MIGNRILFQQGSGAPRDLSAGLNDYLNGIEVLPLTTADALYLGSQFRFNHRFIELGVANMAAAQIKVSLWNGNAWIPAVDVVDLTEVSGHTLAVSGLLSFVPDRENTWIKEEKSEKVSGLSGTKIYDLYWVKIEVTGPISLTTSIKFIGHKFSDDAQLEGEYPELMRPEMIDAFRSGKTDWKDQAFSAAEYIIQDLKEMGIVTSKDQILDSTTFKKASIHKVAEIIFRAFGKDYAEQMKAAMAAYGKSLNVKQFSVDQDGDAELTGHELKPFQRYLTR